MSERAAQTAPGPMAMVAAEQYYRPEQRILDDEFAFEMLPAGLKLFVRLMGRRPARTVIQRYIEKSLPGGWALVVCRKRYIDDRLVADLARVEAVVNLGAGFDTRALRLVPAAGPPVWELDQPANIAAKKARLEKRLGAVPAHLRLVAIDFEHQVLGAVLAEAGYRPELVTFFIWEAVTQYLGEVGVRAVFGFLAAAAPGSRLAFTYVRRAFLEGRETFGADRAYQVYVARDQIWRFGLEPEEVAGFLAGYGWRLVEDASYHELADRYSGPTGRNLTGTPLERVVYAEKG